MARTWPPAQSIEDLEERRLRALVAVAAAIGSVDGLDAVLEAAAEAAREALDVATVSISRWERVEDRLRTLINVGELAEGEERWPADETYPLSSFPAVRAVLDAGEPHRTWADDPEADPAERALLTRLGKEWSAAVPVVYREATWGELYVTRAVGTPALSISDVSFLEVVAAQVAVAVGRAETLSDLQVAAYRDPLTGVHNRRAFDERLAAALAGDAEVVVVFADIDRLKTINDGQGHEAGDRALRAAASTLDDAADGSALAARIGGDEFGLVLEGRTCADAEALAREVDRRLAEAGEVELSWGAASTASHPREAPALMRAADAAQYAAKERHRRRGDVLGDALGALRPGPPNDRLGRAFGRGLAAALRQL